MEDYKNFLKDIKKVSSKRVHKITNSLGVKDALNHYRKNRPKEKKFIVSEKNYFLIIRKLNEVVADLISKGYEIRLPYKTGSFLVEKFSITPKLNEEGKLVFNAPIDWDSTLKLWFENPEEREKKTLVKTEKREIFKVIYSKKHAKYINQGFIMFQATRALKAKIKNELKVGYLSKKYKK